MTAADADPVLVVLAAGMGSRFGGLKQMTPVGPGGETLLEYSVYDAARAGFGEAVFVIRSTFENDFCERVLPRISDRIATDYVLQDCPPTGAVDDRTAGRLWGTAHAVLVAGQKINRPFAVLNADDFYGHAAFSAAGDALRKRHGSRDGHYFLVAYTLGETLSPNGPVSRAICEIDGGMLVSLVEHLRLERNDGHAASRDAEPPETFDLVTPVSMNFWGFTPDLFAKLTPLFESHLQRFASDPGEELRLPDAVNMLMGAGAADVEVIRAGQGWFGMTYQADHDHARRQIEALIDAGVYPERLADG